MDYEFVEPNSPRWLSLEDSPNEEWQYVSETNNNYLVSNYGRLKRVKKDNSKNQFKNVHILKGCIDKNGYTEFRIIIGGHKTHILVHILVAKSFIPNPNNYPFVLHKKAVLDGGTNSVDNLYWGTQKDNMRDRKNENKYVVSEKHKKTASKLFSKPIKQYTLEGEFIRTWDSAVKAGLSLNISFDGIRKCCRGIHKQAGGFMWRDINAPDKIHPYFRKKTERNVICKKVVQFDRNMNFIKLWNSVEDIRKYFDMKDRMNIYGALRGKQKVLKGFIWKYYEEVKDELEI